MSYILGHVNPFASSTIKPSNNLELQGPSIQEEALNTKKNKVNILDHTIMESPTIEAYDIQSPEFIIEEPAIINDSPTIAPRTNFQESLLTNVENPFINVSPQLETLDILNTNISQEFTNLEEIANCRNISQGLMQTEESPAASQQPTQMDSPSSPELDVVQNSSSGGLSEEFTATEEITTSKNKSNTVPESTNKESSNKSKSPKKVIRNRIGFDSSDDEEYPTGISTSNCTKKLKSKKPMQGDETRSKKSIEDDKKKSEKSENSVIDMLKQHLRYQTSICAVCMKEVNNFNTHFNKKHHSLTKTIFPCTKCSHKFFFKGFHDEHQAICTKKSQCICIECKPY